MNKKKEFIKACELYFKVTDGTHDSPKYVIKGMPLVTSKNIKGGFLDMSSANLISEQDYLKINERSKVDQWDLIISMIGEYCGYTYIEKNENIKYCIKNVGLFKTGNEIEANWLNYYLKSDYGKYYIAQSKSGSSQPYLSLGSLRNLPIWNPSSEKKKNIVKVLKSLDDKIELNNKINIELEQMAKTLYDYWFVQFDFPYSPLLEGCPKDGVVEGKPYKSSGGEMVYNAVLKREIPKGWEVKDFGEIFQISRGTLVTKDSSTEGNYKVVSAGLNYSYLHGEYNREKFTITVSGSGANAGFVNFWTERIFACDCTTVRGKTDGETFLGLQFLKLFQNHIYSQAKGSAQPHVYPSDIQCLKYVESGTDLEEKIGNIFTPLYEKIGTNLKQNQELASLRDWLLPMLMNGQVKVGESDGEVLGLVAEERGEYKIKNK